jgi:Trypsin-co-occurring domain 1/CYRIA/CYRIB Rac1 binding domain
LASVANATCCRKELAIVNKIRELALQDGQKILIEVYDVGGEVERVAIGDRAAKTFEAAWDAVMPVVQALSKKLVAVGPTEAQVRFGVKVSTELDAIIASTKGEANFEITLSWKPQK